MFYAILGIIVVIALFLIFRDDHDDSYNKSEKSQNKAQLPQRPKAETASSPKANPQEEQEQPDAEEPENTEVDLAFLETLEYYEELEENTETFDITGLRYHCTIHDCGKITGVVKPEPSNVHDPRAQAVIRSDGKLLGYIPRTQLDWYEDFNTENVECPFVGEIELDRSTARLIAEIKVILPSSLDYARSEIEAEL